MLAVLAAAAMLVVPSPVAAAEGEVTWLCGPRVPEGQPHPCFESLDTTIQESRFSFPVVKGEPDPDPAIDCFYVYPTVSEQLRRNAEPVRERGVIAIARLQASRFAQECRVVAPVYRQLTLTSLYVGTEARRTAGLLTAYEDVRAAWRSYLAEDNRGRGVVLLGHGQGGRLLRRLLREEIDRRPEVRRLLVSAILPGANVLVREGARDGGDFAHVPTCAAPDETGCVIAYSIFNEPPPRDPLFGRVPPGPEADGLPGGPGLEVACTNPTSLGANERKMMTTLMRSEVFPGGYGAGLTYMYGSRPPYQYTPWTQVYERYTARCERIAGAHVLLAQPVDDARRLRPFPDARWGLHLVDVNLPLGELVEIVARQKAAYLAAPAAPPSAAAPRLRLRFDARFARDRRDRRCARSGVRVTLSGADRGAVVRTEMRLRGRRVARDVRAPFTARIARSRARLRPGRVEPIAALARLEDGRLARVRRSVRMCA